MTTQIFELWGLVALVVFFAGVLVGLGWSQVSADSACRQAIEKALAFVYRNPLGIAALVILWLLLTVTTMWFEFLTALAVSYLLLFSLGRLVTGVGLVVFAGVLVFTPFVWGWLILGFGQRYRKPRLIGAGQAQGI